jgi:hypothetical protein
MTKRPEPNRDVMLEPWTDEDQACFSIWFVFFLPSADAPFIPVPAYRQAGTGLGFQVQS